jgi:hypothetical protein
MLADAYRPDGKGSFYDLRWTKDWAGVSDGYTPPVSWESLEYGVYKMPPIGAVHAIFGFVKLHHEVFVQPFCAFSH